MCGTTSPFPNSLSDTHTHALLNHPATNGSKDSKDALKMLRSAVYVESELTCEDQIEDSIYNSPHINGRAKELCRFCGTKGNIYRSTRRLTREVSSTKVPVKSQVSRSYCAGCRKNNVPRFPKSRKRNTYAENENGDENCGLQVKQARRSAASNVQLSNENRPSRSINEKEVTEGLRRDADADINVSDEIEVNNVNASNHTARGTVGTAASIQKISTNLNESESGTRGQESNDRTAVECASAMMTLSTAANNDCARRAEYARAKTTSPRSRDESLSAPPCAAGPRACFFASRGLESNPAHKFHNRSCPSRDLGLHNMCNILRKRPELLPKLLEYEGTEHVFFCSDTCARMWIP